MCFLCSFKSNDDTIKQKLVNSQNHFKTFLAKENSNLKNVKHVKEAFYLLTFEDDLTSVKQDLLISNNGINAKVVAIFNGTVQIERVLELLDGPTNNNIINSNGFDATNDYYTFFGVSYSDIVRCPDKYFLISNVASHLYTYSSTYLNETKIINVPNFKNTQIFGSSQNPNGCTPTAASMLYAYLEDNGYNNFTCGRNLPLTHNESPVAVNEFIEFLANAYFWTGSRGTPWKNIRPGYRNYVHGRGYTNYNVSIEKNYNEFCNAIVNCAIPVTLSMRLNPVGGTDHDVLGIGIKNFITNNGVERYVVSNFGELDYTDEVAFSVDCVRQFYFITK